MLRIFCCACWPNLRPHNTRKFAFCSTRCVFLGYSPRHKGYKCLDPNTSRAYISRDVVFDESNFPFSELHENVGARLQKEILLLPEFLRNGDHDICINDVINDHNQCASRCLGGLQVPQLTRSETLDTNGAILAQTGAGDMRCGVQQPGVPVMNDILVPGTPVRGGSPDIGAGALGAVTGSAGSDVGDAGATDTDGDASESSALASTSQGSHTGSVAPPASSQAGPVSRLKKGISKPKQYTDGTVRYGLSCSTEPSSVSDALANKH
jgi:hypothetical protein